MTGDATDEDTPPSRRFTIIFVTAMTVVAIGWAWVWQARTERLVVEPVPAVAVTAITMPPGEEAGHAPFLDELTASIARIRGLTVTPMAELYDAAAGDSTTPGLVSAARALDVPHVIQGELLRTDGGYRLEIERLDAQNRTPAGSVTAQGTTHEEVIRSITAHLAMSLGLPVPE